MASPAPRRPVLFISAVCLHECMVDLWAEFFAGAVTTGDLDLPDGPREAAYLYVRVGESISCAGLLAGLEPDVNAAERRSRCNLRPPSLLR